MQHNDHIGGLQGLAEKTQKMRENAKHIQEESARILAEAQEKERLENEEKQRKLKAEQEKKRLKDEEKQRKLKEAEEKKRLKTNGTYPPAKQTTTQSTKEDTSIKGKDTTTRLLQQVKKLEEEDLTQSERERVKQMTKDVNDVGIKIAKNEIQPIMNNTETLDSLQDKTDLLQKNQDVWKKQKSENKSSRCCWPFSLFFSSKHEKTPTEKTPLLNKGNKKSESTQHKSESIWKCFWPFSLCFGSKKKEEKQPEVRSGYTGSRQGYQKI